MRIIDSEYNIKSDLNKKIVLISDLHYENKQDIIRLNKILNNIKKINPDFICIPGDIIDRSVIDDEDIFINWLLKLSKLSKTIISIGNHEFYPSKQSKLYGLNKDFYNKLNSIDNLYVLDNKNIIIDGINFMGITEQLEHYGKYSSNSFNQLLDKVKTSNKYYNILLCHSPINICKEENLKDKNINLILCGHMHGGLVPRILRPILKTRGLVSPNRTLFPKNAYGHISINSKDIIITSGCKVLPIKPLNNLFSAEIVTINLK